MHCKFAMAWYFCTEWQCAMYRWSWPLNSQGSVLLKFTLMFKDSAIVRCRSYDSSRYTCMLVHLPCNCMLHGVSASKIFWVQNGFTDCKEANVTFFLVSRPCTRKNSQLTLSNYSTTLALHIQIHHIEHLRWDIDTLRNAPVPSHN